MWCLEDQVTYVEQLLQALRKGSEVPTIALLEVANRIAERIPKIALLAMGTLRCSDLKKEIKDVETYAIRLLRKSLRTMTKEVCSIDANQIASSMYLSREGREVVERSLRNASARARTSMNRMLSDLFKEWERRFAELRSRIASMEIGESVSRQGIEKIVNLSMEILSKGFVTEEELRKIIDVAANALLNEVDKARRKIASALHVPPTQLEEHGLSRKYIVHRVREAAERAATLMTIYVASILVYDYLRRFFETFVNPSQQPPLSLREALGRLDYGCIEAMLSVLEKCFEGVAKVAKSLKS